MKEGMRLINVPKVTRKTRKANLSFMVRGSVRIQNGLYRTDREYARFIASGQKCKFI